MAIFGAHFRDLCWQVFLDAELDEMKRKRKELKVEMRLARQAAKNLERRRAKLMKARQPKVCAVQLDFFWISDQAARHLSHDDLLTILEKKGGPCMH